MCCGTGKDSLGPQFLNVHLTPVKTHSLIYTFSLSFSEKKGAGKNGNWET
jgi:hypothetical protein